MNRRIDRPAPDRTLPQVDLFAAVTARAWFDQHVYSALSSLGRLWSRRGATVLTVLAMGLALALPMMLFLVLSNLRGLGGMASDAREISAFLVADASPDAVAGAASAAGALAGVDEVVVRDPAAGLEELRGMAGFGAALDAIGGNPLPHVLVVLPTSDSDAERMAGIARSLEAIPGVEFVQYDLAWRQRLDAALAVGQRVAWVVGVLLALGALLVVGNTIRLDVAGRAEEIAVVQLLGGTDGFVRRPFLYAGVWYGLMAAVVALVGTWAAVLALDGAVGRLAAAYGSVQVLDGPGMAMHVGVIGAGIVLGWSGAWAAVGRQLSLGKPR